MRLKHIYKVLIIFCPWGWGQDQLEVGYASTYSISFYQVMKFWEFDFCQSVFCNFIVLQASNLKSINLIRSFNKQNDTEIIYHLWIEWLKSSHALSWIPLTCLSHRMFVHVTSHNLVFQRHHLLSFLCSMIWGERWLFVLLILMKLLTVTV